MLQLPSTPNKPPLFDTAVPQQTRPLAVVHHKQTPLAAVVEVVVSVVLQVVVRGVAWRWCRRWMVTVGVVCGVRWCGRWGGSDGCLAAAGGGSGVRWRVGERCVDDWIDRSEGNKFGFAGKSPSEKFSDGGSVVAAAVAGGGVMRGSGG
nr:hypothetical protein [Tanacetum cinerariifolium]